MISAQLFTRRPKWLSPPLLLIIVTIAVYAVTGSFDFLATWDDKYYLSTNETVAGFTLEHLRQAFSGYYVGNYAPFHILSYMIDHALWGLNPAGYHLENVLLHLGCGLLFYRLLRRLALTEWQAFAGAWLFLFHPVQVETVAWVSQRKSLLAMFFFLLALLGYHAYTTRTTGRLSPYLLSLGSLAAALLSKSIAVIFPAVILLYDFTYDHDGPRTTRQRLVDKLPYLLVAGAFAAMAIISQAEEAGGGRREYPGGTPLTTFYTMVPVLISYLRDCFFPFTLSPYYMVPIRQQPDLIFAGSLVALVLLLAFGFFLWRRARPLLFWYGLFFIALLPVLQFVPLITLKNDRYLYTPLLGLAVLLVACYNSVLRKSTPIMQRSLRYLAVAVMLALPLLALQQTLYWRDDVTIWNRAIAIDPENRLAWLQLAKGYTALRDGSNSVRTFNRYHELRNRYGPVRGFESQ